MPSDKVLKKRVAWYAFWLGLLFLLLFWFLAMFIFRYFYYGEVIVLDVVNAVPVAGSFVYFFCFGGWISALFGYVVVSILMRFGFVDLFNTSDLVAFSSCLGASLSLALIPLLVSFI